MAGLGRIRQENFEFKASLAYGLHSKTLIQKGNEKRGGSRGKKEKT
jgi:hypothetical protein